MRKHSVRKWLHAVLDLLPVLILPIFAIYEINHDHNEPISVEVAQNEVLDFNQLKQNGDFLENYNGLYQINATCTYVDTSNVNVVLSTSYTLRGVGIQYTAPRVNEKYVVRAVVTNKSGMSATLCVADEYSILNRTSVADNDTVTLSGLFTINSLSSHRIWVGNSLSTSGIEFDLHYFMLFNLTQMYGVGNEPSLADFNNRFNNDYYDYTLSDKQFYKDVSTVTYDDTDVGSQMIYSLYKPVVNYFDFNNVFNFGAIYDWFQLNMFNGNAPMVAYIVWNIIVYEFIMDILFLVYSVFMFLIDFAEGTLEKFTGWCTRG